MEPLRIEPFKIAASFFGLAALLLAWYHVVRPRLFRFAARKGFAAHAVSNGVRRGEQVAEVTMVTARVLTVGGIGLGWAGAIGTVIVFLLTIPFAIGSALFGIFGFAISATTHFSFNEWIAVQSAEQQLLLAVISVAAGIGASLLVTKLHRWNELKRVIASYPFLVIAGFGLAVGGGWHLWSAQAAGVIWAVTIIVIGTKVTMDIAKELAAHRWGADVIAVAALVGALWQGEYLAGAVVALMTATGEAIEAYGFRRATRTLQKLLDHAPKKANRLRDDGDFDVVPVGDVVVGDRLQVNPGDVIPVDGTVLGGSSDVDTAPVTGEPLPVTAKAGVAVQSGTVNLSGALVIRAEKPALASTYGQIVEQVRAAQERKAPLVRLADRVALGFSGFTALTCLVAYFTSGDSSLVLAVLVVATPCPLLIAAPIAVLTAMNQAARVGIVVKSGAAMERLAEASRIFFDKTGTLTKGEPRVVQVVVVPGLPAKEVAAAVAALEKQSNHVLGRALREAYDGPLPIAENVKELPGRGLVGTISSGGATREWSVGGPALLDHYRVALPESLAAAARAAAGSSMEAYVLRDGVPVAAFRLADELRPEAQSVIASLRHPDNGNPSRRIVLLTGDRTENALPVAKKLRLDDARGSLMPAQKVELVAAASVGESTVMVGDGINDAPALAAATVGVSLSGHGASISSEAADVVLLRDDLRLLPVAFAISAHMRRVAWQSIGFGIGLSALAMLFAAAGKIPPVQGALLQEAIDIAVIASAVRLGRVKV